MAEIARYDMRVHTDVYKRQQHLSHTHSVYVYMYNAVSYTHLDVYKRQVSKGRASKKSRRGKGDKWNKEKQSNERRSW